MSQESEKKELVLVKILSFWIYDWFWEVSTKLSSKGKFYSSLTGAKISDNKYGYVLNLWNKFEMKAMKGYHDLYLKCDVLLLAVIFKKIRNYALKNYGLCPSHYLSVSDLMSKFLPT